ncbi:restriction endonuclease [Cytobacillus horneckiae]|uniref:Restriction endonuclease n=1 Tax=Cytobacillus horneckiae TaxID=549687 RepID=A0A2N0ZIY9_9BACI|nr:restriction endonuclease [Cytobacillus horneckiae]MEC1159000.1 restriction endonuclease [Cytobacillus horneckiae]MED2937954.1 restriction endonuclease [Cytobacillus horneckiae]PKG29479.1 restriction endonuclease [Cytobacillus horneckiae]
MKRWWMIRAGDNNELIPIWKDKGIASIGWPKLENPKQYRIKDEMTVKANTVFTESKPRSRSSWVNQVWRFSREIKKGDRVITYNKEKREYMVGSVLEPHFYDVSVGDPAYPNNIMVDWEEITVERDSLSQAAKNSLGSVLTVFRVDDWGNEIENLLEHPFSNPEPSDEVEEDEIIEDLVGKATVMVQDKVDKLDPWQMQELVGGLLRAMEYNVQVSPKGPDGGVDVLAYKDAFGFEKPIIKVQVKHRKSSASAPDIQQLLGANPIDANSLFVSTGGFTSQAVVVAKHNSVRLVDLEELVDLVMKWYENMPSDVRALLPLQKMYVPE